MNTIHNSIERRNFLQFDILVNQRVGLNKADHKGLTPLMKVNHEPNKKHSTEMVRLLLRQSPKLDIIDRRGRNALMHAALVGNAETLKLLLDAGYFDQAMRDHSGNAPIHYAAMSGDLETIEVLLEQLKKYRIKADLRNDQGMTPLHMACAQGHVEAARYLHSEADCSLTTRDGIAEKTAREWLQLACDIPPFCDPFSLSADISGITLRKEPVIQTIEDNSQMRIFILMKEKPDIDDEEALDEVGEIRPPWDINTKVEQPPKYLRNGVLNPARFRPGSARMCRHYSGTPTMRPFSAPCGIREFDRWKHPFDIQPYLSVSDTTNFRRYSSVTDLINLETDKLIRMGARVLSSGAVSHAQC